MRLSSAFLLLFFAVASVSCAVSRKRSTTVGNATGRTDIPSEMSMSERPGDLETTRTLPRINKKANLQICEFANLPKFHTDKNKPCESIHGEDFWQKEGTFIVHQPDLLFREKPLKIYEKTGKHHQSVFGTYIEQDVCTDGVCKVLKIWIYWDLIGNYHGFDIPCNEPLTKSDHTLFSQSDYTRLHEILQDSSSILGKLDYQQLILEKTTSSTDDVDAVSAATSPALEDVVVREAVYSCYSLWHTVYGEHYRYIQTTIRARTNTTFLSLLLKSNTDAHRKWAIQFISESPEEYLEFTPVLCRLIEKDSPEVSVLAVNFFSPGSLNQKSLAELIHTIGNVDTDKQSLILEKLSEWNSLNTDALISILKMYENEIIDVTLLRSVYLLVKPEHLNVKPVQSVLKRLSQSPNAYIRNLTDRLLEQKN